MTVLKVGQRKSLLTISCKLEYILKTVLLYIVMNKVLMSRSVIFKQQSANVVQRSQMTFSRLQCIMYD